MIRRYCDSCGLEIEGASRSTRRIVRERHGKSATIRVELLVSVNGTWNGGDVCTDCVVDAVDAGEEVPAVPPLATS